MKNKRILIAGEGGQGVQVLAKILVKAAFESGLDAVYLPNFGVEQRGGVSLAYIQLSSNHIPFPKFDKADIVLIFAQRAVTRIKKYNHEDTIMMFDNSLIKESELVDFRLTKVAIPATYFAKEKLVPKNFNIILLGALIEELSEVKEIKLKKIMDEVFSDKYKKEPQLRHFNLKALEIGKDVMKSIKKEEKWRKKILDK